MIGDYKIILRDIVELFYHSPFKIFNVNSIDKETLVKPFGYFISLGITTSMESLKYLRDIIKKSDYGFEARIVELESIKSEEYGDFLNFITNKTEEEITKYPSVPLSNIKVYTKDEAQKLYDEMTEKINKGDYSISPIRQKLSEVIKKIDNWEDHGVQMKDEHPGIFHKYINYKKTDDSEFRIGIYVTKT